MSLALGLLFGFLAWFVVRHGLGGIYTVNQDERAVLTSFGRAERVGERSTLESPLAQSLRADEKERYRWPEVRVIGPGLYFKFPWQRVHKVPIAVQTTSIAHDPEYPDANERGTVLEAVTKDQLNTGLSGQLRYRVSEQNLYAYLFGVKNPAAHLMGYFVSVLRERISNFEARRPAPLPSVASGGVPEPSVPTLAGRDVQGISINDLRKNLNDINEHMTSECASSAARYGIALDAALITGIDPPPEVDAALAAINTAHNHVSSEISLAQASADQKIVQSRRAVEIETLNAQSEVEPLTALADQLRALREGGPGALDAYVRNARLALFRRARQVFLAARG
jgi:regulator of protease activity HflC (stomatin/prohibitin superfamily)